MVQNVVQLPFPDRIQNQAVLLAELLLFLRIAELDFGRFGSIGRGSLADAASAHKNLCLEQQIAFTRLALHVINRVHVLHIGIEAENHRDWVIG